MNRKGKLSGVVINDHYHAVMLFYLFYFVLFVHLFGLCSTNLQFELKVCV